MMHIPVYERWEWKPKKHEIVMASQDGKRWVPLLYFGDVGHEYPDRPHQCAEYISAGKCFNVFAWKYIAKPEDILKIMEASNGNA